MTHLDDTLGCSTLWWADEPLTAERIDAMAQAGVDSIEIADYHPNVDYLTRSRFEELSEAISDAGMTVATVHTHLAWHDPALALTATDPEALRTTVGVYRRAVDILSILGADVLVTHDVNWPDAPSPSARATVVDAIREIADVASDTDVRIAIENTTSGWASEIEHVVSLLDEIDHPAVGMVFDTAHAHRGYGDAVAGLEAAGSAPIVLHLNDSDGTTDHLLPGRGAIDWDRVIAQVRTACPDAHRIYELADADDLPALADNVQWLLST